MSTDAQALIFSDYMSQIIPNQLVMFLDSRVLPIFFFIFVFIEIVPIILTSHSFQFSQSYLTLCNPMNCSMAVFLVHHQLPCASPTSSPAQSCLTLCDPMDYTVHGILQAGILEWVAFLFSRGSSQPRDHTQVSHIAGRFFTT